MTRYFFETLLILRHWVGPIVVVVVVVGLTLVLTKTPASPHVTYQFF